MVQEQIVDYINTQMKNGVTRDAIKTTLTGAGWQAVDVEDTLKKIESAKMAQPMGATPASAATAAKPVASAGGMANPAPQTIKMSDLVSSAPAMSASSSAKPTTLSKSPMTGPAALTPTSNAVSSGKKSGDTLQAGPYPGTKPHASRGALITDIVLVVVILAVGGFAGFLYMQNSSLNSQIASLNEQSSGVNAKLTALTAQVAASTTALTAQVASLGAETQDMQTELSFYSAPSGTVAGATVTATLGGMVSGGGKVPYVITATYGGKVYVSNSKSASVIAALNPLMATPSTTATTAEFSGTYVPGSDTITLTTVNGSAVQ
jgi:hypothetical protein